MTGIFGGVIAFFFPVISEIFIGFTAWKYDGFNSPYIQWLIVLLLMWLFRYVLIFVLASFENKVEKEL
jgi:hypothetical protein